MDTGNNGGTHVTLNTDAIEEVKVLTSNYQAEYGKAAGGQIAFITKGGTNEWHGNGRFFHRNEGLNANDYFNKQQQLSNGDPNDPAIYRYNYVWLPDRWADLEEQTLLLLEPGILPATGSESAAFRPSIPRRRLSARETFLSP